MERVVNFVCPHCWETINEIMINIQAPVGTGFRLITTECPECLKPLALHPGFIYQRGEVKKVQVCGYHYRPDGQIVLEDRQMATELHFPFEENVLKFNIDDVAINLPGTPISAKESRQFAWDLKFLCKPGGIPLRRL